MLSNLSNKNLDNGNWQDKKDFCLASYSYLTKK